MHPKISVIIPIYNAQTFLAKCIESILDQTFKDFELILVNDGSIDSSLSICKFYGKDDNRIIIIDQPNAGVSSARNIGIDNSSSDYIIFIDADDYTDNTMLEELYDKIITDNADIVFCDFYYTKYNIDRIVKINFTPSPDTAIERILNGQLQGFMCNKMIKRSAFIKNKIKFDTSIAMGEDMFVMCQLLLQANRLSYVPKAFFHYVQHKSSAVATRSAQSFMSQNRLVSLFHELLVDRLNMASSIMMYKIFVKKEMLLYGNFSHSEIRNTFPEVNSKISKYSTMNTFEKLYFSAAINNSSFLPLYKYIYLTARKAYSTKLAWLIKSYI